MLANEKVPRQFSVNQTFYLANEWHDPGLEGIHSLCLGRGPKWRDGVLNAHMYSISIALPEIVVCFPRNGLSACLCIKHYLCFAFLFHLWTLNLIHPNHYPLV